MTFIGFLILVFFFVVGVFFRPKRRKTSGRSSQSGESPRTQPFSRVQSPKQPNLPAERKSASAPLRVSISMSGATADEPLYQVAKKEPPIWYGPGSTPKVGAHSILNGMVYVGQSSSQNEAGAGCVIDPSLAVAPPLGGNVSEQMGYWPSYQSITPSARGAYLQWLSSGKLNPDIGIGYVFLYFYGIERRLLVDRPDADEETLLLAEVGRLRSIYSRNGSFDGYSRRLIEAVDFLTQCRIGSSGDTYKPDLMKASGSMPLPLKVAIARKVVAGSLLDFEWAVAALIGLPSNVAPLNSLVVNGARPQFLELLRLRFERTFPQGFRLRNRKTSHMQIRYQAASAGLSVNLARLADVEGLPDPETLNWTKLAWLAAEVCNSLEPLAQAVLRQPQRANSLWALTLCPPDLAATTSIEARTWLSRLTSPIAIVNFGELARHAIGETGVKWTLRHHRLVAEALVPFKMGLEPDPAEGSERLEDATEVVVIVWDHEPTEPSPAFPAAAAALLVAEIARANVERTIAIEEGWLNQLPSRLTMQAGDMLRLQARLCWLRKANVGLPKARKLLAGAATQDREFAVWSAVLAIQAAGPVEAAQVAVLESLCDKLDVPRRSLYSILHGAAAAAASPAVEPVTVNQGEPARAYAIPRPPQPGKAGLDQERLLHVRKETERASSVLAQVFVEDEPVAPAAMASTESGGEFDGLDETHASFAQTLIAQPFWSRADFEAVAQRAGLMADGALEVINEWAFEHFDEPLLDDGDRIEINPIVLQEMTDRREAV